MTRVNMLCKPPAPAPMLAAGPGGGGALLSTGVADDLAAEEQEG